MQQVKFTIVSCGALSSWQLGDATAFLNFCKKEEILMGLLMS